MTNKNKLIVVSLTGPSAAGKSTVVKKLSKSYEVLEEKYMQLNTFKLDNRLLLSKWAYINYWITSILQAKENGVERLITDRCPIDTCAYIKENNVELLNLLRVSLSELSDLDIVVKTVLVTADFEVLQKRIESRLQVERIRLNYNEDNVNHNRQAYDFFQKYIALWDNVIDTTQMDEGESFLKTEFILKNIFNDYDSKTTT